MTVDTSDTVIFVRTWKGELERARCKHCALLLPLMPYKRKIADGVYEDADRSNYAGHCKYFNCIRGRICFCCSHFQPKESFKLVSSIVQSKLF